MEYEIHVTVNPNDYKKFVEDCNEIGVKPIIIETDNRIRFEHQVMTSSKYKGEDYKEDLNFIVNSLIDKGHSILRKKVEIKPEENKNENFVYYESHFRLKLEKNQDTTDLRKLCKTHNFHFSKNLFKKDENFDYQMITYRDYESSFEEFNMILSKMKDELNLRGISYDKIEIEECIFDSNEEIDNLWLN